MVRASDESALAAALAEIPIGGNLLHASRLPGLVDVHGATLLPFLTKALLAGSKPIRVAALEAMSRVAPARAIEESLVLLAARDEEIELRATAATTLGGAGDRHADAAVDMLLEAANGSGVVAKAALRALETVGGERATLKIRAQYEQSLRDPRRKPSAAESLTILSRRPVPMTEDELLIAWRAHRGGDGVDVQIAAVSALLSRKPEHALAFLAEGIPGANEKSPDPARLLLPAAVLFVMCKPPEEAFDLLSPYLMRGSGEFAAIRLHVILELLRAHATGEVESSWMAFAEMKIAGCSSKPDARWRDACHRLAKAERSFTELALAHPAIPLRSIARELVCALDDLAR